MLNLAITSPSTTDKPETFVQSHIDGIRENVTYYYGDLMPRYIAGRGLFSMDNKHLGDISTWKKVLSKINPFALRHSHLNIKEYLLAKSLKDNKIDVVLAEYGTTGAEIFRACEYAGIPLIVHFHGRDCTAYDNIKEYGERWKKMFVYASKVIAVSHDMEKRLMALGCPKEKLVYAPCCPDESFASLRPSYEKRQFVFVGRFTDKKAPYATIMAFEPVAAKYSDARLIMAGSGPLHNSCVNLVKILGLDRQVLFSGQITPSETRQFMVDSLAYVQHSIIAASGDMEGTPVSVMEASAMGLPVVATRHAGIPDVIIDEETGLLCDELDVEKMGKDMLRLADDFELAKRLGANGRKRMKEHFSKKWQMDVLTKTVEEAW